MSCNNTAQGCNNSAQGPHGPGVESYTRTMHLYYFHTPAATIDANASVTLNAWVAELDESDPLRQFVLLMAEHAVAITLQHETPYQHECEVYARSRLVPANQFDLPRSVGDDAAANQLGIPVEQLIAHRADYGYDHDWNRGRTLRWVRRPGCGARRRRCHG